jgi:UDP-GlcNAc3NAcA epimerase
VPDHQADVDVRKHVKAPLRLALCFGTRPQVIKAAVLLDAFRARWPVLTVDTGQHYDFELNGLLYQELGVARPDHFLEVGSADPATQTASVLTRTAEVLQAYDPTFVVVIGDTNSTLGCALAASKLGLPVVHVEAGLRSSEPGLPEEANRRLVDVIADLLCAPSERSASRLRDEQAPGLVTTTGDVARDILIRSARIAPPPRSTEPFALATIHRAALTEHPGRLRGVIDSLGRLGLPVVFPMHPRTRRAIERHGLAAGVPATVSPCDPFGYLETIAAARDAAIVVTDSGGLQREAYWLGTPCVTLRSETEWFETVDCGANVLVPPEDAPRCLAEAVTMHRGRARDWPRDAYGDGDAATRVADAVDARYGSR